MDIDVDEDDEAGLEENVSRWATSVETVSGELQDQSASPDSQEQLQDVRIAQSEAQTEGAEHKTASDKGAKESTITKHASTLATPAVRHLTKQFNIDLGTIEGTGKHGRVLKEDVYRSQEDTSKRSMTTPPTPSGIPSNNESCQQQEQHLPLSAIQTQMFKTMTRSLSIPQFMYADEYTLDRLVSFRTRLNRHLQSSSSSSLSSSGIMKLTYLPFIIKAVSLALLEYPLLNSRLDLGHSTTTTTTTTTTTKHDQNTETTPNQSNVRVVLRSEHNISIAMATPHGLLVPNIKSVQTKSILAIGEELHLLQGLALRTGISSSSSSSSRVSSLVTGHGGVDGKGDVHGNGSTGAGLSPNHLTGGTFTISNIGSLGGATYVAPIVVQGQVAILGLGRVRVIPAFSPSSSSSSLSSSSADTSRDEMIDDDDDDDDDNEYGIDLTNHNPSPSPSPGRERGKRRRTRKSESEGGKGKGKGKGKLKIIKRSMAHFSYCADHRLIDGALMAAFSQRVKLFVEDPEMMLSFLK